jgi:putative lipase involved disintegration of autophagic bodies
MRSPLTLRTWDELEDDRLAGTLEWEDTEIEVPDTEDVETLAAFGRMTSNAYTTPDSSGWYDIGDGWNRVSSVIVNYDCELPLIAPTYRVTRSDGKSTESEVMFSRMRRTRLS